jgi:uncharacterized protein YktA (UPF0223 family)
MKYYIFKEYQEALINLIVDSMLWIKEEKRLNKDSYVERLIGINNYNELMPKFEAYQKGQLTDEEVLSYYSKYKDSVKGKWAEIKQIDNPDHEYFNFYCYPVFQPPREGLIYIENDGTLFLVEDEENI